MNTPHKHAEVIKAWADGAAIELKHNTNGWQKCNTPNWCDDYEYRVKPEPKPDVVEKYKAEARQKYGSVRIAEHWEKDNLKLTFSGETGQLIKAEVV